MSECVFCHHDGGILLSRNDLFRVVLVDDESYPGFIRLILNSHVKEATDISLADNLRIMEALYTIEQTMRSILNPDKINLASFGNMTPHLHWHIIPRFANDCHFPNPIWGEVVNPAYQVSVELVSQLPLLSTQISKNLTIIK